MVREVITISVGQCGNQLGTTTWKQYCAEHFIDSSIDPIWKKQGPSKYLLHQPNRQIQNNDNSFKCFFEEIPNKHFIARNISIDLEPNVIDNIKTSSLNNIFNHEHLLNGNEDAASNFARGHYTIGKEIIDKYNETMRKIVDHCDNIQGFIINHSVSGGTGSGLGALILERIAVDYRKKSKISFSVYPSPNLSTSITEPYNALLTTHWLLDHTEVTLVLDNEACYEICQRNLNIIRPSYNNINKMICKVISSMTASLRFEGELNVDLNEFQTGLVPFPRLHFYISSHSPILTTKKYRTYRSDVQNITDSCFGAQNFLTKIADFDAEEDKYMAISVNYRGDVKAKEANATVQWLKTNKKVTFVEWCPTGFKIGLNDVPHAILEDDDMALCKRNITMIGNNTAISRVFSERISKKYDLMYSQRAFVHWYVGEGMEEGEFAEAREDLGFLEKDYLDVLSEQATDDDDEEEDSD